MTHKTRELLLLLQQINRQNGATYSFSNTNNKIYPLKLSAPISFLLLETCIVLALLQQLLLFSANTKHKLRFKVIINSMGKH